MGIVHQCQQGKLQRRTQMTSILPRLCYSSSPVSPKAGTLAHKLPPGSMSPLPWHIQWSQHSCLQRLDPVTYLVAMSRQLSAALVQL